jgi:mannose-1-phosphate guanylyltransferase
MISKDIGYQERSLGTSLCAWNIHACQLHMASVRTESHSRWCIVVADSAGPDWPVSGDINAQCAPIQYCGLGEPTTLLQRALHRAVRISHAARVMVTAAEAHRSHWQHAFWFMRPEHRFVSESPGWSLLTTAAAVLSIAARAPKAVITILPARCYVGNEWALTVGLHRALSDGSILADGIATLGMIRAEFGVDEDYLVLSAPDGRPTFAVTFTAQRPRECVSQYLIRRGAVVASGIYLGYARTLASLLYKYWPALTHKILRYLKQSVIRGVENRIPPTLAQEELRTMSRPFWDHPAWLPLRVLRVADCGWSSLCTARAIERVLVPRTNTLDSHDTELEDECLNHEHIT